MCVFFWGSFPSCHCDYLRHPASILHLAGGLHKVWDGGGCGRKVGQSRGRKEEIGILFTYEKKVRALQLYEQTHSVTETIRILGYPERATLYRWISEKGQPEKVRSTKRGENTPDHPRHPSVEVKLQVLHRCFEHGEDVKSVSEEIGYSRASIYNWRRKYLQRGLVALMNPSDDPREELVPGTFSATEDIAELKAQVQEMQMQIDILKETINVLKKRPRHRSDSSPEPGEGSDYRCPEK